MVRNCDDVNSDDDIKGNLNDDDDDDYDDDGGDVVGNGGHVNESTQLMFKKDKEIVSSRSDADSRSQSSSQNSHQFPRTLSIHPVADLAPFPRQNLQIFGLLGT